jgi:hypothetical protein
MISHIARWLGCRPDPERLWAAFAGVRALSGAASEAPAAGAGAGSQPEPWWRHEAGPRSPRRQPQRRPGLQRHAGDAPASAAAQTQSKAIPRHAWDGGDAQARLVTRQITKLSAAAQADLQRGELLPALPLPTHGSLPSPSRPSLPPLRAPCRRCLGAWQGRHAAPLHP